MHSKNNLQIINWKKTHPNTHLQKPSYPENIITEIKQQQKTLSEYEESLVAEKYSAGISTYKLAKEFNCHRTTISRILKKHGITVSNEISKRKAASELILQMYSEMYRPKDIAEVLNIGLDSVRKCLKENNVEIRKSWEYPKR